MRTTVVWKRASLPKLAVVITRSSIVSRTHIKKPITHFIPLVKSHITKYMEFLLKVPTIKHAAQMIVVIFSTRDVVTKMLTTGI